MIDALLHRAVTAWGCGQYEAAINMKPWCDSSSTDSHSSGTLSQSSYRQSLNHACVIKNVESTLYAFFFLLSSELQKMTQDFVQALSVLTGCSGRGKMRQLPIGTLISLHHALECWQADIPKVDLWITGLSARGTAVERGQLIFILKPESLKSEQD